jgi:hypothetical protein
VWQVGKDVSAGTYTVTVPKDSTLCYWDRLRDLDATANSIIDNGTLEPGSHGVLTVKASDGFVTSQGCGTWTRR